MDATFHSEICMFNYSSPLTSVFVIFTIHWLKVEAIYHKDWLQDFSGHDFAPDYGTSSEM